MLNSSQMMDSSEKYFNHPRGARLGVETVYLAGRFVVGFGNSLSQLSCPVLLTEICHPQHRGKVSSIYNCLWDLGACGK
jgi:hypothetical protein